MTIYGIDFYGSTTYGRQFVEFRTPRFEAEPRWYRTIRLDWDTPSGDWDRFRLLVNRYGFSVDQSDGRVLAEGADVTPPYVHEADVAGFHYYTIWVRDTDSEVWYRSGHIIGLAVEDFGFDDFFFDLIPGFLREWDRQHANETLQRITESWAFGFNLIRSEYDTIDQITDPYTMSGNLLPLAMQQYGKHNEPVLGMRQNRIWLANMVLLNKQKGSLSGVRSALTALTGWGVDLQGWDEVARIDIVPAYDSAVITDSHAWTGDTLVVPEAPTSDEPSVRDSLFIYNGVSTDLTISADPLHSVSLWYRGSSVPNILIEEDDATTTTVAGDPINDTREDGWVRYRALFDSANPVVRIQVSSADTTGYLTAVRTHTTRTTQYNFVDLSAITTLSADLFADRINLIRNPSFESNVNDWGMVTGTIAQDTSRSFDSNLSDAAAQLDTSGTNIEASNSTDGGRELSERRLPTVPLSTHTISTFIRLARIGDVRLKVEWRNFADEMIELDTGPWETHEADEWVRQSYFSLAPREGYQAIVYIEVEFGTTDANNIAWIDGVMFEHSHSLNDYFDGALFGGDALWEGDPDNSRSHYYIQRAHKNYRIPKLMQDYKPVNVDLELQYANLVR